MTGLNLAGIRESMPIFRKLFALCLALTLLTSVGIARAEQKTAVVDSQRAMNECEDGLRVQATLKKLFDARQRELDRKQNELQKEREQLEKQRSTLKPDQFQARAEKWQREMEQVQQTFVDYNREFQRKQLELTQPIQQKLLQIVTQMAAAEGYDLVVERQTVLFARAELDLTERTIKRLNESASKK